MTDGGRGPSGRGPAPPPWLATAALPISGFPAGSTFTRIHRIGRHPIFFSPGDAKAPVGRFDSARAAFGVLYASSTFAGAFVETVLRMPGRTLIGMTEISGRAVAILAIARGIRLVDLRGEGLQRLGLDASIFTGPYEPCGLWSDALFDHPDRPDGLLYPSRHDPAQSSVALFGRDDLAVSMQSESVPLARLQADVGAVLRRYRKGVDAS